MRQPDHFSTRKGMEISLSRFALTGALAQGHVNGLLADLIFTDLLHH